MKSALMSNWSFSAAIAAWKNGGSPEAPGFRAASDEFYAKYVWRRPVPADLDSTMATFGNEQYNYMQGAYEFVVTGTLKNYDARADLPKIKALYSASMAKHPQGF